MTSQDFFAGSGRGEDDAESFAFINVGDAAVGDIVHVAPTTVDTKYGPRLPIQLRRDDQTVVTLWIKQGQMASAIIDAARQAGADGIAVGGRLAVSFESEKPTNKGNPMKVYAAAYKAPTAPTVNLGDAFPGATPATAADLL
jgi:hypothetical protein